MAAPIAPATSTPAPAPTTTPPQTATAAPAPASSPAPTSSPAPASSHGPTTAPGSLPLPTQLPPPTATFEISNENQPPQTRRQRLAAGDRGWLWKLALRAIACVSAIIGIGCIAWAYSTVAHGPYAYEMDDQWSIVWSLITFGFSLIWCFVCIVVYLLRCPHKPMHPGAQVGVDLILWLGFIPTALLCVAGALSVVNWGSSGIIGEYSSYGYYTQANNGTWVWNATEYAEDLGRDRICNGSTSTYVSYYYYDNYGFASCADEDLYVNNLWKEKPRRAGAEVTGTVCQFLNLILHFTLFVWACVDTHRRRSSRVTKQAEKLASQIVMNMVRSGAVVQPPNEMAQPLLRPQQQPMQFQPMQPQWMQYRPQQPPQTPMMSGALGPEPSPSGSASGPSVPAQAAVRDEKQMSVRFA